MAYSKRVMALLFAAACGDDVTILDSGAADGGIAEDGSVDAPRSDSGDGVRDVATLDVREPWGIAQLRREYGILETVAGAGEADDGNDWLPASEGGPAIDAELSRPHTAQADEAGNLYITDKEAHAIRRVDPAGIITTVAGTGVPGLDPDGPATASRLNSPNGIWVLADGTFYVLDLGNDLVRRVTPDGQMTTLFEIGGASTGRGLWVADDESHAYVAAGSRLLRWTVESGVETLATGFVSLGNLHVSPDGQLGVTDRGGHRVYAVADDGERTLIAGNGTTTGGGDGTAALDTGLDEVRGIWFHPRGGYLLATHDGCQVWFVDPAGAIHLIVDGANNAHSGDGMEYDSPGLKISEPRAVTMDFDQNILITESDEGYVRRILRR